MTHIINEHGQNVSWSDTLHEARSLDQISPANFKSAAIWAGVAHADMAVARKKLNRARTLSIRMGLWGVAEPTSEEHANYEEEIAQLRDDAHAIYVRYSDWLSDIEGHKVYRGPLSRSDLAELVELIDVTVQRRLGVRAD